MNVPQDFLFVPLGGSGEIGMNLNLYRCDGRWLAIDCGIGFGGADLPGVEVMTPDPSFIVERKGALEALLLTHAHEDHLGAVPHLWRRLGCPVIATPFAAAVLKRKLGEVGLNSEVPVRVVRAGDRFTLGPFDLELIAMSHSIPEAVAVAIRTRHARVLHTGDWKLDPDPLIGPKTDEAALARFGEEGVLAMVCDSTNALVEGHSGSEADVRRNIAALIRTLHGRIGVTCFATNVARIESVALAARAAGREVALVGRSMRNIAAAARDAGYLKDLPPFLDEDEGGQLHPDRALYLIAGSQGEGRSALTRVASGTHPNVSFGEGDTVIYSARMIPGNEKAVRKVQDDFTRSGVTVMTDEDHMVHVSGHPARDELARMYGLVRPRVAIPVHGEFRHMAAHAELARERQAIPLTVVDGDVVRLSPGTPQVVDQVPVGRLALDGLRLVPVAGGIMSARRRMLEGGMVVASLAVDASGRILGAPQIAAPGVFEDGDGGADTLSNRLARDLADLPAPTRRDDVALRDAARGRLRKRVAELTGKKPNVEVHLMRIGE